LALIIFVVSEKKAFEHFPLGSNVNLRTVETKLPRNDHWKVLYKVYVFYADRKSKMAATAGHRLTLDPIGKCSNALFSETTNRNIFPIGSNVKLNPAVAAILNFISEQEI
jgi:hypothetical protein